MFPTTSTLFACAFTDEQVRGYQIRGTRVSDPGYEGIRSGVRGYQIWGTRVSDLGYEGIRSGVRGYQIRGARDQIRCTRVSDPVYEGSDPVYKGSDPGLCRYYCLGMMVIRGPYTVPPPPSSPHTPPFSARNIYSSNFFFSFDYIYSLKPVHFTPA